MRSGPAHQRNFQKMYSMGRQTFPTSTPATGESSRARTGIPVCLARPSSRVNSQQQQTPLLDAVLQRGNALQDKPFHVPGHKRGRALDPGMQELLGMSSANKQQNPLRCDLTEIAGLDYLSSPTGVIAEAQQAAAAAFGADHTWFLVNGCSGGIHAAVMATVKPGQTILLARNCHLSAFSACVATGCRPLWLKPEEDRVHGVAHCVMPEELTAGFQEAKAQGLSVGAVLVVSPTYYGAVARISELAAICHAEDVPLLVDEAHGGHLDFINTVHYQQQQQHEQPSSDHAPDSADNHSSRSSSSSGTEVAVIPDRSSDESSNYTESAGPEQEHMQSSSNANPLFHSPDNSCRGDHSSGSRSVPVSALSAGADVVVHSSHKVLTAMTQAAMLHLKGTRVRPDRISKALQVLQTSSPSYILLSSLDAARRHAINPANWLTPLAAASAARRGLVKLSGQCNNCLTLLQHGSCGSEESIEGFDPLRLVVNVQGLGLGGYAAAEWLEDKHHIVPELATAQLVVFVLGPGSTLDDAQALVAAFRDLCAMQLAQQDSCHNNSRDSSHKPTDKRSINAITSSQSTSNKQHQQYQPEAALSPRDAFYADSECIELADAAGRVSAELLCPYPPGVPVLFPGEVITAGVIEQLQDTLAQGGAVTGAHDSSLKTVLVVAGSS